MRTITFFLWIFFLKGTEINAQLTLESVYEKVNHLEVEVAALKVNIFSKSRLELKGNQVIRRSGVFGVFKTYLGRKCRTQSRCEISYGSKLRIG